MNQEKALWKASKVFAPDYPRQSSDGHTIQAYRGNRPNFCNALINASENQMPGYYSVYSFPRGHSRDGNIPEVDCIFIDLDIANGDYKPNEGKTQFDAWRRDMSALIARARMIASAIIENGEQDHFRATLSGHKGLHLYLDFPTISPGNGSFNQYKNGLKTYGKRVMSWLDSAAGGLNIDQWVDVDASDLGRLARHPNTIHHNAKYDDATRWCVPVTIQELSDLTVDDYLKLTQSPRWPDGYERNPSTSAGDKVIQSIRNASSSQQSFGNCSTYNYNAVKSYEKESNNEIDIEDIMFLASNYPCIKTFRNREDAFDHGNASHVMEVNVISKLVELNAPRNVIHDYLKTIPGYNEDITDEQINKIIGREYKSFNCNTITEKAPQFCLEQDCSVYNRSNDLKI